MAAVNIYDILLSSLVYADKCLNENSELVKPGLKSDAFLVQLSSISSTSYLSPPEFYRV